MLNSKQVVLRDLTVAWARVLKDRALDWETGIYPGEMAAFLAQCEAAGVASIIESGRGLHAYSTRVLGEYAERTGATVISIDMDSDPAVAAQCRKELAKYRHVSCLTGDAFQAFPDAAARLPGPIGVLLDGPKGHAANRLAAVAAVLYPVRVLAVHNADPGLAWTLEFGRLFPGAYHYESLDSGPSREWADFKAWEREAVKGYELPGTPGRSLSISSLAIAEVAAGPMPESRLEGLGGYAEKRAAMKLKRQWERRTGAILRGEA